MNATMMSRCQFLGLLHQETKFSQQVIATRCGVLPDAVTPEWP
jgi:arginine/ornithine N-succinyltransferase beta subunit